MKVAEEETNILRTKTNNLEQENDKLLAEIKKIQLQASKNFVKGSNPVVQSKENEALKGVLEELRKECEKLKLKLKLYESGSFKLPERTSKIYSDSNTKFQLKVCIDTNIILISSFYKFR